MKKLAFALTAFVAVSAAHAAPLFDAIYADTAQTTLRTLGYQPNVGFENTYFAGDKFIGGFFTTGSAATSASYVQFLYENTTNASLNTTFTGTVSIFSTVNPELKSNVNSSSPAYSGPLLTQNFSQATSIGAYGVGVGGFSLTNALALEPNHLYGFAIKIDSASYTNVPIVPAYTNGAYAPGNVGYAGYDFVLHGTYGSPTDTAAMLRVNQAIGPNNGAPNGNVGFALYASAPVPEPSALAALGLGAVGVLRRRKRA